MPHIWRPSVTVAAVIERDGRFLLIEEETSDGIRLNQPAGHLDPLETLEQAVVREVLEETAYDFTPTALVGMYMSRYASKRRGTDVTYLRFTFCGEPGQEHDQPLDDGILRTLWMTRAEMAASAERHRSPIVLQCVDDYLAGKRAPLELLHTHASVFEGGLTINTDVTQTKKKVVIGMSGGVDSSVAAWMLKEQGYEVIGLFMKNWEDDDDSEFCSSRQDWIDAASVADVVGVDIEAVNFAAEYKDRVFAEFLREYQAGRTPNPDVLCNAEIKFKAFLDHAMLLGADLIATGHYARVREIAGSFELLKAVDHTKDQSYFLHRLNQAQLSKTLFPLGEIPKTEVRKIAEKLMLPNAAKKDSTGICFIGERPFRDFLNRYLSYKPGPMKTDDGTVVGEHVGLSFYTLGQRKGIGVGGMKKYRNDDGSSDAWYVARKDIETNTLYIVQGHDRPWLLSGALRADQASWVAGVAPEARAMSAKTRYRQADVACVLAPDGMSDFALAFTDPQWAVTPGQSAVLYDGDVCLGGGIIDSSTK